MKKTFFSIAVFLFLTHCCSAQKDYKSDAAFTADSIAIFLKHWHTQRPEQDTITYATSYVWQYFKVENDTLYADIPEGYIIYNVTDPMSGRIKSDKEMVTVMDGAHTHWFRTYNLIGHPHVAICPMKKPALVYLSL